MHFGAFAGLFLAVALATASSKKDLKVHLVTVATEETDGLKRLRKSAEHFGFELNVLGLGQKWNGGDMQTAGGGQKIRLLREGLQSLRTREDMIILFVDAYDVVINGDEYTLLDRLTWEFPDARIVFGAEPFCWPDKELVNKYPHVKFGDRFLNSGLIMGYAPEFLEMLDEGVGVKDEDDDQLFYTRLYLDNSKRKSLKIALDSLSRVFINLNGQKDNVKLEQGMSGKPELKPFPDAVPKVFIGLFIAKPVPYVEEFLNTISGLDYETSKLELFIYNNQAYNEDDVLSWVKKNGNKYAKVKVLNVEGVDERDARKLAIEHAIASKADYYITIDAEVHFTQSEALQLLIRKAESYDYAILAPALLQPGKLFSNFWGAISSSGFYERSDDYRDLAERVKRGTFNVPFLNGAILISKQRLSQLIDAYHFDEKLDSDMSFAAFCRYKNHFMMMDNLDEVGFLVTTEFFEQLSPQTIHKEVYDYPNNKQLWAARYIHEDYPKALEPTSTVEQPCPDVFDFPFVSPRFAAEAITIMNGFGQWSSGSNTDERLAGGYENVPTRDIHMKQVGLHNQWLQVLDDYVGPMQEKVFQGYYSRPVHADMMFVVRYKPEEQSFLRPHHDASTYSVDIALNQRGVDFEGGGVRYIRYNCTVPADQVGHSMLFPGRLTHLHEGLPTTKGTRYILVSFINP